MKSDLDGDSITAVDGVDIIEDVYDELNCFTPVILPEHDSSCYLVQTFVWLQDSDYQHFVSNWTQLR